MVRAVLKNKFYIIQYSTWHSFIRFLVGEHERDHHGDDVDDYHCNFLDVHLKKQMKNLLN